MSNDPWTDPNPQPGDFDADLATLDPRYIEYREGDRDARLFLTVSVQGVDVKRLERIAEARGTTPGDVVAELLREADKPAA